MPRTVRLRSTIEPFVEKDFYLEQFRGRTVLIAVAPAAAAGRADLRPLAGTVADGRYIDATREVLRDRGGLWFYDESYVISRRRA